MNGADPDFAHPLPSAYIQALRQLFEHLPDVYFFAKNRDGQFIMGNQLFAERCGVSCERDILGKTDRDFFPPDRSSLYRQDDRRVMETRKPLLNRVEPAPAMEGDANLFITTKVPIIGEHGEVEGIAGIARDLRRSQNSLRAFHDFHKSLAYIGQHFSEAISIPHLARLEGMSVSQFERRFKDVFNTTPLTYVQQTRIRNACDLLIHTDRPIVDIALECGFYDHSHFTRHFRRAMNEAPLRYRKNHTAHLALPPGSSADPSLPPPDGRRA